MTDSTHDRAYTDGRGESPTDISTRRLVVTSAVSLILLLGASPWVIRWAIAILGVDSTTPIEWVPASFPARQAYVRFTEEFESGDVVVASWPGCTLDTPAIDEFIDSAIGEAAPRDATGRLWFDTVVSGKQAVERLTTPPLSLDRETAIERLRGVIVGPDGRRTCVVVGFTRAGLADRRRAVAWIRDTLLRMAAIPEEDIHLAGPVIDNLSVDAASQESLQVYGAPAAAIVFGLTWFALRSFRYALLVFLLSLGCVGLSFASLQACGDRMNPVLIVMPLLVLTLGVSGGIHLVNYLVAEYRSGDPRGAAWRAVRVGWIPCCLSAGTTAIGLASLVVSELEPIRVFGFHAAIGVLGTLVVLFLVVPGIFATWPISRRLGATDGFGIAVPWAEWTNRRCGSIAAIAALGMLGMGLGVPGIRTSVGIDTLFTAESRVIRDYAWLEHEIGPLVPVEVVLRFAEGSETRAAERLDIVREVGEALENIEPVAGVSSAAIFFPDLPDASPLVTASRKAVIARKLESSLANLTDMRLVRQVDGGQLWRVTARTSALTGLDYGDLLREVRGVVEPVVRRHGGPGRGIAADFTGAMPLVNAIQTTLLRDLFSSFLSACCMITLVMMVVEGGVAAGLVAMVPNIFPMVLLFGALGWARAALDIGSVMTASVALGMAVDGTFHFLTFYRLALGRAVKGDATATDRAAAIRNAFEHAAGALVQSSLVCGLGILAFAASSFAPTRRFAWMLSLLVTAALAGDLIVLPALLATRLGRWFRPARPGNVDSPTCDRP
ncbi:MAG: efflux RND transporter permease subunit [Planctomycetia bacterium]